MATISATFTVQQQIARASAAAGSTWTGDALADDDNFCVHTDGVAGGDRFTNWLVVSVPTGLAALPDTADVTGIQVPLRRRDPATADGGVATDVSLIHVSTSLSSPNGTGKTGGTEWPAAEGSPEVWGGTTDIWGHASLTGADIKSAGFSIWLSAHVIDTVVFTASPEVDRFAITITYTATGQPAIRRHGLANKSIWGSGKPGHNHFKTAGGILLPSCPGKVLVAA